MSMTGRGEHHAGPSVSVHRPEKLLARDSSPTIFSSEYMRLSLFRSGWITDSNGRLKLIANAVPWNDVVITNAAFRTR